MSPRILVDRDVSVPMRDGTRQFADVYRPDTGQPVPAILSRTPYDKGSVRNFDFTLNAMRAAEQGYAVVYQDTRGRLMAEGEFNAFRGERDDGYDSVEWLAAQPWCSGPVGMVGGSYIGGTQWDAAIAQAPHLKAICPNIVPSDWYEGWVHPGGAFHLGSVLYWVLESCASEAARRMGNTDLFARILAAVDDMGPQYEHLPLKTLPLLRGTGAADFYFDWLNHPDDDDYWKAIAFKENYGKIRVPALNMGGWYDLYVAGTLENFTRMQREGGSPEARQGQRLLMGPWSHGLFGGLFPEVNYGLTSGQDVIDITAIQLRFFDYHLKGLDNGLRDEPPVHIFTMGADEWRFEREWPLARAKEFPWYLHGGGTLSPAAPADELPDTYVYDPRDPAPTVGGPTLMHGLLIALNAGPRDQQPVEARSDVLVFSSDVLDAPLEVTGPITVTLYAATSAPDTDFVARLTDVFADGRSLVLTEGIIRARYRQGFDRARPIVANEVYEYTIDLAATSNVFLPGHRLRLDVTSSSFPRFDRNLNSGKPLGEDTLTDAQTARQTIFHDSSRPSHVLLPIVP